MLLLLANPKKLSFIMGVEALRLRIIKTELHVKLLNAGDFIIEQV